MDIRAQTAGRSLPHGILLVTLAFLCAAVMSALSKEAAGVPPLLILFLQYAISFLLFLPAGIKAGPAYFKTQHFGLQLFRSLAGSACQLLFFIAVRSISLLDAVLLSNAAPLFIPLVVYLWFRKTVQPLVWVSLLIGFIGILMIIKPGPEMLRNPASLIALGAGVLSAVALVATNKLAETEPPARILIYNFGVSTFVLIPMAILEWQPLARTQWLLLLGVGGFYAATQYLIILAYRYADAAALSPFNYTVVIFSGVLGWWLFGNIPGAVALLGTLLICAAGILSIEAGHVEGHGHSFGNGHWRPRWKLLRTAAG